MEDIDGGLHPAVDGQSLDDDDDDDSSNGQIVFISQLHRCQISLISHHYVQLQIHTRLPSPSIHITDLEQMVNFLQICVMSLINVQRKNLEQRNHD